VADRIPLFYTFGNHMHWVDMQWLWGYHVLPGSVRDMLHFCRETGARGNLNFDGVGYEKLAAEAPDVLRELREAVQDGTVEIVGASYGQPYGLFHGGESNVRQRVYGVRSVSRLLGVRPDAFWEEEFDFFPQLPQMLAGVGMRHASLFFQWTWHTPEVPTEESPAVWWVGQDGTRLLAATRNRLNLHQWPEDVAILMDDLAQNPPSQQGATPMILQWLELMPSPDWMCRSEVLLPKTKELLADPRFDFRFGTLSEYLRTVTGAEPRRYGMDDVFHGMSLGKNGDLFRRLSAEAERSVLFAESLAAVAGLFGRPYAQWDVYPTWEIEEAWRELLQAQHHDNDECEGLCGHVGRASYDRSLQMSQHVIHRTQDLLVRRCGLVEGERVVVNPLGWSCEIEVPNEAGGWEVCGPIDAFGYRCLTEEEPVRRVAEWQVQGDIAIARRGDFEVEIALDGGYVRQIRTADAPQGLLDPSRPLFPLQARIDGMHVPIDLTLAAYVGVGTEDGEEGPLETIYLHGMLGEGFVSASFRVCQSVDALDVEISGYGIPRLDGGFRGALRAKMTLPGEFGIVADQPYGVNKLQPQGRYLKKYPTGDWMTSPQWFEEVHRPFTGLSFVEMRGDSSSLLIAHDGSQQWLRTDDGIECILSLYDPWDESYFVDDFECRFRLIPSNNLQDSQKWKAAQEFRCLRPNVQRWADDAPAQKPATPLPRHYAPLKCHSPNVAVTAFFRETDHAASGIEGHVLAADPEFAGGYPYVLRLVELDGIACEAGISFSAEVADARRTNLMGEGTEAPSVSGNAVKVSLRPFEIATVYLDLVEGRKQTRDLDAHREVWATVHRVD
jgi:alpha-mannosidase